MAAITALEITVGSAFGPAKFKLWVNSAGISVPLSPLSTFLWTKIYTGTEEHAVSEIRVLYDDEATPESFKKLNLDVTGGGTGGRVFLAFSCVPGATRVVATVSILQDAEPADPGFVLIDRTLTRSGIPIRLAVKYVDAAQAPPGGVTDAEWLRELKVGDVLDCLDRHERWHIAKVTEVCADGDTLSVSFKGWDRKHNESLPRSSPRIARPGSQTANGKESRVPRRQGDAFCIDLEELASLELRIDDFMAGGFSVDEQAFFFKSELPLYVEEVLTSKLGSEELQERVNAFNQKILALCVWHIKRLDEPLPQEIRQHLNRLFLNDPHCNFFFEKHGAIAPVHRLAETTNGWAARIPLGGACRFYVGNINQFYTLGGYDAVLQRIVHLNALAEAPCMPAASAAAGIDAAAPAASVIEAPGSTDPLTEACLFATIMSIPRYCYTEAWSLRYYQPMRDMLLARVLLLSDAQLNRTSPDSIDLVEQRLLRLGKVICSETHPTASLGILTGPSTACAMDANLTAAFDRWSAKLAVRLIRCDSLALRVRGASDLRKLVEQGTLYGTHDAVSSPVSHWFDKCKMVHWFDKCKLVVVLRDNTVLDVLLGVQPSDASGSKVPPPVHVQTMTHAAVLMTFLSQQAAEPPAPGNPIVTDVTQGDVAVAGSVAVNSSGCITVAHIDALFGLLVDQDDDALRRAAFDAVNGITRYLPIALLDRAYGWLSAIPAARYDDVTVTAVKDFTQAALISFGMSHPDRIPGGLSFGRTDETLTIEADFHHWYGMTQLWIVIQGLPQHPRTAAASVAGSMGVFAGDNKVAIDAALLAPATAFCLKASGTAAAVPSSAVIVAARDSLVELCRARSPQASFFLERCIHSIRPSSNSSTVTTSLHIAGELIDCISSEEREPLLLRLAHTYGLPGVLTEELRTFKTAAASTSNTASFLLDLNARLAFLGQFLRESSLTLTEADVTALWGLYVDNASCSKEAESFFAWLSACRWVNRSLHSALPYDAAVGVFLRLFSDPSRFRIATMGIKAYKCFESLFWLANASTGALFSADDTAPFTLSSDVVVDTDGNTAHATLELAGLPILWAAATLTGNPAVSTAALDCLIALYMLQPTEVSEAEWDETGLLPLSAKLRTRIWLGFVAHCMSSLRAASSAPPSSVASRGIVTSLRVLSRFLEEVESLAPADDADSATLQWDRGVAMIGAEGPAVPLPTGRTIDLTGFIQHRADSKTLQRVVIKVRPVIETISMLRSRIAELITGDVRRLRLARLSTDDDVLSADAADNLPIVLAGLTVAFSGVMLQEPAADTRGSVYLDFADRMRRQLTLRAEAGGLDLAEELEALDLSTRRSAELRAFAVAPRRAISEDTAYFDLLCSLLASPSQTVVAEAWALIRSLPVNDAVQMGVVTLQGALSAAAGLDSLESSSSFTAVNWDTILDSRSPLKLLCSLQIINKMLDGSEEEELKDAAKALTGSTARTVAVALSDASLASLWARTFVQLGGLAHLASVVMSIDLNAMLLPEAAESGQLTVRCLQLLLQVFSRFVSVVVDIQGGSSNGWRAFPSTSGAAQRPAFVRRMLDVVACVAASPSLSAKRGTSGPGRAAGAASATAAGVGASAAGNDEDGSAYVACTAPGMAPLIVPLPPLLPLQKTTMI